MNNNERPVDDNSTVSTPKTMKQLKAPLNVKRLKRKSGITIRE